MTLAGKEVILQQFAHPIFITSFFFPWKEGSAVVVIGGLIYFSDACLLFETFL